MNIPAEAMLEALNIRAGNDPLVREILRSTMYEVALKIQLAEQQNEQTKSENPDEQPE